MKPASASARIVELLAFSYGPLASLALLVTVLGIALLVVAGVLDVGGSNRLAHKFGEVGFFVLYAGLAFLLWFYPGVSSTLQALTGLPELWLDIGLTVLGLAVALGYEWDQDRTRS